MSPALFAVVDAVLLGRLRATVDEHTTLLGFGTHGIPSRERRSVSHLGWWRSCWPVST